jgi:hypothetical protein
MTTDQVRIESLYAGLYRTVIALGLLLAAGWLFALLSFYLSRTTGADWFARSGSVMALVGAAVTFRLANFYQRALARRSKKASYRCPEKSSFACNRPNRICAFRISAILLASWVLGSGAMGTCWPD